MIIDIIYYYIYFIMPSYLSKGFLKIDFLSENLSFEKNGSKSFKSLFGALISFLVIISAIVISALFGKEIFQKKLPATASYYSYTENSEFSLKTFPIFFLISDANGKIYKNWKDYFNIWANLGNINNGISFIQRNKYQAVSCTKDFFEILRNTSLWNQVENLDFSEFICFNYDDDAVIKNDFAYVNSTYININFSYKDPKYNDTVQSDYLLKKDDFYIRTNYINNYINPFDYNNPINLLFDHYTQQVSSSFLRRSFFQFTKDEFISDNGFLFENKIVQKFVSFSQVINSIDSKSIFLPHSYYWVTLSSPRVFKVTFRAYVKIQELAAKIGGVINALTVMCYLLFSNYLRFSYILDVGKAIVEAETHMSNPSSQLQSFIKIQNSKHEISNDHSTNVLNEIKNDKNNISRFKINHIKKNENLNSEVKNNVDNIHNINIKKLSNNYTDDLKSLDEYLGKINYLEYLFEQSKSFLCCFQNDPNFIALEKFMNYHLDFFINVKRLAIVSGLIKDSNVC